MYNTAVIGCGFIGFEAPDNHTDAYRQCKDTQLWALCDTKFQGGENWIDYLELVQNMSLDIVSVCTPPETHRQVVCDIAPYVKAIYCEKPIALTLEDADKMIETCKKHNVILQVNHQRRFIPVKARFSRGIMNTGTHMFDLLRQVFGEAGSFDGKVWQFGKARVEVEYMDSNDHIFELDCTHSAEPMILAGVEHLVDCLNQGKQSISSGEEARKTLRLVLEYEKIHASHN